MVKPTYLVINEDSEPKCRKVEHIENHLKKILRKYPSDRILIKTFKRPRFAKSFAEKYSENPRVFKDVDADEFSKSVKKTKRRRRKGDSWEKAVAIDLINKNPYEHYIEDSKTEMEKIRKRVKPDSRYELSYDGVGHDSPVGPAGAAYLIREQQGELVHQNYFSAGYGTSNMTAEFLGMLYGVKTCYNLGIKRLNVCGKTKRLIDFMTPLPGENFDSKITMNIPNEEHLRTVWNAGLDLGKKFKDIQYMYSIKPDHTKAKELAQKGYDDCLDDWQAKKLREKYP